MSDSGATTNYIIVSCKTPESWELFTKRMQDSCQGSIVSSVDVRENSVIVRHMNQWEVYLRKPYILEGIGRYWDGEIEV